MARRIMGWAGHGRRGSSGLGLARQGLAGPGRARLGLLRQVRRGWSGSGTNRLGRRGEEWWAQFGVSGLVNARLARLGGAPMEWQVTAWCGWRGQARLGSPWSGLLWRACLGVVRLGWLGAARHCSDGWLWLGLAGKVRRAVARFAMEIYGVAGPVCSGWVWRGGFGRARRVAAGVDGCVQDRQGEAQRGRRGLAYQGGLWHGPAGEAGRAQSVRARFGLAGNQL